MKSNANWKTCFGLALVALTGNPLAGGQFFEREPNTASLEADPSTQMFTRSASGKGMTVLVARQPALWTSRDRSNWVQRTSGSPCRLYDVAFGHGIFVAVGNEGTIITSPDGISWIGRN